MNGTIAPMKDKRTVPAPKRLRVGFILTRSFTLSAFALFVDTLRLASDSEDQSRRLNCDWEVLSSTKNFITSSSGIQVAPTASFIDPSNFDYIAVVGGLLRVEEPIDSHAITYLRKAADAGVGLIGLCTGSFVLAETGLLNGHTVCVSWLHHREFRERFPTLKATSEQIFVFDGKVATSAGGSSVADLAASLVRHHIGEAAERNALEILQISHRREATDVQPRNPLGVEVRDKRVYLALMIMEQHIEDPVDILDIASMAGVSRRQLERLFHGELGRSPAAAYAEIRMRAAVRAVLQTERPIIEIAIDAGFENVSHFTRRFRVMFGETPSDMRRRHRAQRARPQE